MSSLKIALSRGGAFVSALLLVVPSALADNGMHSAGGDWWAALDHYCERIAPGFWGEPLNAVSNIGFVIAAAIALHRQRRAAATDAMLVALALIAGSVGVGSFLFHTLANRWTLIADIVPIAIFIYLFFFHALRRFLGVGNLAAGLATMGLLVLSPLLQSLFEPLLGASATYAPGIVATFGVAAAVTLSGRGPVPRLLLAAGMAFSVALVFRVTDNSVCGIWPHGTHFLWHSFNAVAVGLALVAAERTGSKIEEAPALVQQT